MSFLGNLIWFFIGGFVQGLGWLLAGVLFSLTVIGLPIGLQCFKLASLQFAPFGKEVVTVNNGAGSLLLNLIWIVVAGWALFVANLAAAAGFAVTIIGIPFAIQSLKLAWLSLAPFGKDVR